MKHGKFLAFFTTSLKRHQQRLKLIEQSKMGDERARCSHIIDNQVYGKGHESELGTKVKSVGSNEPEE